MATDSFIKSFSEMKDIYLNQILTEDKDYGEKYEGHYKKSGKKSKDYDGDDKSDEYAGVKDKAISGEDEDDDEKEYKSKKRGNKTKSTCDDDMQTESFSSWRTELYEVISKLEEPKMKDVGREKFTEKRVSNTIIMNPNMSESIEVLDEQELSEEFILETANIATEYLYNQGLNENGLEMVIDYLGEDKFIEYVFCLAEDYMLTEARRSGRIEPVANTGRPISQLYGGAKATAIRAKRKLKAVRDDRPETPSSMTSALRSQSELAKRITADRGDTAVKVAVEQQPKTKAKSKTTKDRIARGILGLISNYEKGMERHRAAMQTAGSLASATAKTASKVASAAKKGSGEFASGLSSGVRMAAGLENSKGEETKLGRNVAAASLKGARTASRAARDITARQVARERSKRQTNESVQYIIEKAASEQQQKIFGLALAVKRGEVSRSKVSDQVLQIVDDLSETEIRKFAATKHKGLPKRK
jgi:hypothetical protein